MSAVSDVREYIYVVTSPVSSSRDGGGCRLGGCLGGMGLLAECQTRARIKNAMVLIP